MDVRSYIVAAAFAVMFLGTLGIVVNRIKTDKGVGYRVMQWLSLVILPPTVIILAAENFISSEIAGAAVMALIGYAVSEFTRGRRE